MDNENALRILKQAIPVLERAAAMERVHAPERRALIRKGIREYKAAYKYLAKQLSSNKSWVEYATENT
jgi:hypothetical protein